MSYYQNNKERVKLKAKIWNKAHPDKVNAKANRKNERIRSLVVEAYGSQCACCSESEKKFLSIDHIDGTGAEQRKITGSGSGFYRWLWQNKFPKDNYRLLCHNCNHAIGMFGICPHQGIIDGPEKLKGLSLRGKRRARKLRLKIVSVYGGKCVCCGEDEPYFLTIDHINGGGKVHRIKTGRGNRFYKWLEHNNFPTDGFQLMCMNCNKAKGTHNICPHSGVKI